MAKRPARTRFTAPRHASGSNNNALGTHNDALTPPIIDDDMQQAQRRVLAELLRTRQPRAPHPSRPASNLFESSLSTRPQGLSKHDTADEESYNDGDDESTPMAPPRAPRYATRSRSATQTNGSGHSPEAGKWTRARPTTTFFSPSRAKHDSDKHALREVFRRPRGTDKLRVNAKMAVGSGQSRPKETYGGRGADTVESTLRAPVVPPREDVAEDEDPSEWAEVVTQTGDMGIGGHEVVCDEDENGVGEGEEWVWEGQGNGLLPGTLVSWSRGGVADRTQPHRRVPRYTAKTNTTRPGRTRQG